MKVQEVRFIENRCDSSHYPRRAVLLGALLVGTLLLAGCPSAAPPQQNAAQQTPPSLTPAEQQRLVQLLTPLNIEIDIAFASYMGKNWAEEFFPTEDANMHNRIDADKGKLDADWRGRHPKVAGYYTRHHTPLVLAHGDTVFLASSKPFGLNIQVNSNVDAIAATPPNDPFGAQTSSNQVLNSTTNGCPAMTMGMTNCLILPKVDFMSGAGPQRRDQRWYKMNVTFNDASVVDLDPDIITEP